jgi:hypothetical protein
MSKKIVVFAILVLLLVACQKPDDTPCLCAITTIVLSRFLHLMICLKCHLRSIAT